MWQDSFVILQTHIGLMDVDFIHPVIKNLPILFSLSAMAITVFFIYDIRN
jgi:hypothetical protein